MHVPTHVIEIIARPLHASKRRYLFRPVTTQTKWANSRENFAADFTNTQILHPD
jgi:hypothetical protein